MAKKSKKLRFEDYYDRIILLENGTYDVIIGLQDGKERIGNCTTENRARSEWVKAQKILNGNKVSSKDVPLYKEVVTLERVK